MKTTLVPINKQMRRRSGLTLIEVIASLTLLSALMVMILFSFSQHQRQLGLADERQQANLAMDQLLSSWFETEESMSARKSGRCEENPNLSWRCSVVEEVPIAQGIVANLLRVEIFGQENGSDPLSSVEIVDHANRSENHDR